MQAVLDTNVIVSAVISPKGPPAEIIRTWRAGSFVWVTSEELPAELERTLQAPRLKRYLAWEEEAQQEFFGLVREGVRIVAPTQVIDAIKDDPDDNRILEAAVEGEVDYIVSGDRHLQELDHYREIPIVTPARFAAIVATGLA